ncbi:MAG: histidine phosphatase family protein [Candidatus Omnitrophica bacterium]|nr:histidine phosphatase family protein [Candidatus Omnitrophota bacterium]
MTRLLIIRHGETKYNLNRRYCGFSNPPLNVSGISQAESLAKQLKVFDIAAVYSSDLLRAIQTAEIVFPKLQIKTMLDFRELNFGIFEGLNYSEIMERYPELYRDWIKGPSNVLLPNGEEFGEFRKRVSSALSSIISLHREKTIALVTHSGPIRLILCEVLCYGFERFWEINQDNAAFSIIDYPERSAPVAVDINETK